MEGWAALSTDTADTEPNDSSRTPIKMTRNDNFAADRAPPVDLPTPEPPEPRVPLDGVDFVDTSQWKLLHRVTFDPHGEEELATTLIFGIAEATGTNPLDHTSWPPLYESIDAQSLQDALFRSAVGQPRPSGTWTVTFEYEGLLILLTADGWICIYGPRSA